MDNDSAALERKGEGGFTLIELLVSITILSVILVLLGAALRVISKNWDTNSERIEAIEMISRAFDLFHRDVSGMQRVVILTRERPKFVFIGTQDELSFVVLEPPYPAEAGPYFIQYSVAAKENHHELVRARAPYLQGQQVFPGATPANNVPLVQGPYKYTFAYAADAARGSKWLDSWKDQARLPALIRLQISEAETGKPMSPPFIVAVKADAELNCLMQKSRLCTANRGGGLASWGGAAVKETER